MMSRKTFWKNDIGFDQPPSPSKMSLFNNTFIIWYFSDTPPFLHNVIFFAIYFFWSLPLLIGTLSTDGAILKLLFGTHEKDGAISKLSENVWTCLDLYKHCNKMVQVLNFF